MRSQRALLGMGLFALLLICAASIFLEFKSRSDALRVTHSLEVLHKLSDAQLLIRQAESAARGFALANDPRLAAEYRESLERIGPALADLTETTRDNPRQTRLLESTGVIVAQRFAGPSELVRLREAGDTAGMAALIAKGGGISAMAAVTESFGQLVAEEERLLAARSEQSQQTGSYLVAAGLVGTALVVLLALILIRDSRELKSSLRDKEGENERLEAAVADRTRHLVVAQEQLLRSTSVIKSMFAGMAEAALIIDAKGAILLANRATESLLGYRPGMTLDQLRAVNALYRADGTTIIATGDMPVARAMRGEQFDQEEVVIRQPGRHDPIHTLVSCCSLHDAAGEFSGAALIYHDVTAGRDIERKLHQSQKLDAIGKLTGGVAHDFNNMLTVITGTTEILVAELGGRSDLQDVAALIDQAADRCSELIKHLLAFARKQPLQPRNVDINETIQEMCKLLKPTLGEQIEVRLRLADNMPTVHIDPSQLANALLNLAINARDAMPHGGKLILEAADVVLDEAYARMNPDARSGAYAMVAVTDTGSGMPPGVRDKIFEPFFTTKETGRGTGLGLSMVYGFVKQSGGHIKVYSEEGLGTTFKLYLPTAAGSADAVAPVVEHARGAGETVLVVEDDDLVRGFVLAQLNSLGYKTLAATDSRAALELEERGAAFDLLFTDMIMPGGLTGRQLADEMERRRPGTKVLYTSGYTEDAIVHHGRLDPGVLLLSKPYRKSELSSMVRRALGEESAPIAGPEPGLPADTSPGVQPRQPRAASQARTSI
ncbi:CHASE3 domain-containing protein [Bradyrhizobium roseum]|uniref:CHASE3 domain-containing protein n=1 Tax=Bradyrhizobium roseum TaxID=3056648 RepID=UPI0026257B4A|nr:CHASE3 domain-containing protein [Bradyrhizobium roseus]WKA28196.1 CHASE3 domain-containing protein [Bradyrhizobium roseus]